MHIQLFLVLLSCIVLVYSYPSGAPKCANIAPDHESFTAKSGKAPYVITATLPKGPAGGQTVTVTITGNKGKTPFKGFILYARAVGSSTNIGKFTAVANTKVLTCNSSSNAITHKDNKNKNSVTFKWNPAKDFKGKVEFSATIVKKFDEFWSGVKSAPITIK